MRRVIYKPEDLLVLNEECFLISILPPAAEVFGIFKEKCAAKGSGIISTVYASELLSYCSARLPRFGLIRIQ